MRHRKKSEKFSRSRAQKKALVKSLVRALLINERIKTTTSRAKYLRTEADRLVTLAKKGTLADKRLAYKVLGDHKLVSRLFEVIGPRFQHITGGYTRILNVGIRKGDGASLSLIEFTRKVLKAKGPKVKKEKAPKVEKEAPKKESKIPPKKETKSQKGIFSGVKKVFKKERDAL